MRITGLAAAGTVATALIGPRYLLRSSRMGLFGC